VGWVPLDLLQKAPALRITLGKTLVDAFVLAGPTLDREYEVDDPRDPSNAALLVIETDATARPPNDPRDLGVAIERVIWEPL
jgi:hypothetical protein